MPAACSQPGELASVGKRSKNLYDENEESEKLHTQTLFQRGLLIMVHILQNTANCHGGREANEPTN